MPDRAGSLDLAHPPDGRTPDVLTMRRFLPAIANTPRRAAVSTALIAGLAAGPLAGHAGTRAAAPTANPVVAAVTGTDAVTRSAAPATKPGDAPKPVGSAAASKPAAPASSAPASPAPAAPPPAPPAPPSDAELLPAGAPIDQSHIDLGGDQSDNAKAIIRAAKELNLPPRAAVIAVATSLQESKLNNFGDLGDLNDHDSLGLFQQRPSSGWGAPDQLTNPDYATRAFLNALTQVPGWQTMPLTDAAQTVQVSAFGGAYAQWEQEAADIVRDNYNNS
jgi:hypothetical protein